MSEEKYELLLTRDEVVMLWHVMRIGPESTLYLSPFIAKGGSECFDNLEARVEQVYESLPPRV